MKSGRNDSCSCGSGKKYKRCCLGKISENQLEQLYLQQLELTKSLKDKDICLEVLALGEKILSANRESKCITGTYVNMAVAKRILYFLEKEERALVDAKEYCKLALNFKPNNQVALRMLFGISLGLREYQSAYNAFELYEITDIGNPMSVQLIEEYQSVTSTINEVTFSEDMRVWLNKITDTLFEKFGFNAGICGVAATYYLGIGNDNLKAYELAKRCIEDWPNAETYNNLGLVCLNEEINRKEDAVNCFLKAIELEKDIYKRIKLQGNYFLSLMETNRYEDAETLIKELIHINPCNQNFSNYAELLKRLERYDDALSWGYKALYLVEDDTTLLVVADICKRKKDYENAIEMYLLCLGHLNNEENTYVFNDHNQDTMISMASNNSLESILYEVLRGLISVYCSKKDYESAKLFLNEALRKLPQKNDWDIWNQTLSDIIIGSEKQMEIENTLKEIENSINHQKKYIRQWANNLLQLQSVSEQIDLDENDGWESYQKEMDQILLDMKKIINRDSDIYNNSLVFVQSHYAHLNEESKEFLITAETLYEIHKVSVIDFAPIIVEYSKVVEKQLRVLLGHQIPSEQKTLGGVLYTINERNLQPYKGYLTNLYSVNRLRKRAAHTGFLTKSDVDRIREIFYENNLLNLLN